jgi:hypothetical protein
LIAYQSLIDPLVRTTEMPERNDFYIEYEPFYETAGGRLGGFVYGHPRFQGAVYLGRGLACPVDMPLEPDEVETLMALHERLRRRFIATLAAAAEAPEIPTPPEEPAGGIVRGAEEGDDERSQRLADLGLPPWPPEEWKHRPPFYL